MLAIRMHDGTDMTAVRARRCPVQPASPKLKLWITTAAHATLVYKNGNPTGAKIEPCSYGLDPRRGQHVDHNLHVLHADERNGV
jgi:hypothetical protein